MTTDGHSFVQTASEVSARHRPSGTTADCSVATQAVKGRQ